MLTLEAQKLPPLQLHRKVPGGHQLGQKIPTFPPLIDVFSSLLRV